MLTTSVVRNQSVTPQDPGPAVTSKPTAPPMEITLVTNLTLAGLKITVLNSADSVETQPQQVKDEFSQFKALTINLSDVLAYFVNFKFNLKKNILSSKEVCFSKKNNNFNYVLSELC